MVDDKAVNSKPYFSREYSNHMKFIDSMCVYSSNSMYKKTAEDDNQWVSAEENREQNGKND
jgi:hypothetical protein